MKTTTTALLTALALGASVWATQAQDNKDGAPPRGPRDGAGERPERGGPQGERPDRGPGGPGGDRQRRPMPPIIGALDANGDGVIDEQEIANASAALRKLDKNGDGKLTMEEMMPPRSSGFAGGPEGGPNGQRGPRDGGPDGERRPEGAGFGPEGRGPRPGGDADGAPQPARRRPSAEQ